MDARVLDHCTACKEAVIDPVKGRDGLWGISLVAGDRYFFVPRDDGWDEFQCSLLSLPTKLAVWDVRRVIDWPLSDSKVVWDVRSLYGGERNLLSLAQETAKTRPLAAYFRFIELEQRMAAHTRALRTARIDLPAAQAVPTDLLTEWVKIRAVVVLDLFRQAKLLDEYEGRWPFVRALREMELNGIHVDVDAVEQALNGNLESATGKALRDLQRLARGGFVTTLLNPMGGATGRVRLEGGFNSLGVPKGLARDVLTSRFDGGLIYTFDFNAIDYRCIVRAAGGAVAELYRDAQDFHERTASFVFREVNERRRSIIKYLSYIYIYGGSEETVMEKTGLTQEQVRAVVGLLDDKILPIKEFRERLWMEGTQRGYIEVPGGGRVTIEADDSPGKVIGRFAQSFSSRVFERALVQAQRELRAMQSRLTFAVHDELVIDAHPDEFGRMEDIRRTMEFDNYVVKMKRGRSYGEIE